MLAVILKIGNIDYEETLKAIFPWIAEQIDRQGTDHWAAQLIRNLGDGAEAVALGVFRRLRQEDKDELLARCVNAYGQALTRKANDALSLKYGSGIQIGSLFMERDEGMFLQIRQIRAAYGSLSEQLLSRRMNPLIRMATAASGRNGAEHFEALLPAYMREKENKRKLIREIQGFLNRYGLIIQLEDMDAAQETAETPLPFSRDAGLSENLKAALCDAAAGFLKELL